MPNKYHFRGGIDLMGRMFIYESEMKKNNLCSNAIKEFADAIKSGNLASLKTLFDELVSQQKRGLLNFFIDYNELFGNHMNLSAPYGYPLDLAKKFKHENVYAFLELERLKLSAGTLGATMVFFGNVLPKELSAHIAPYLTFEEGVKLREQLKWH